jgi:hypothetical protein
MPHWQSRLLSANVKLCNVCSLVGSPFTSESHARGPESFGLKVNAFFCLGNLEVPLSTLSLTEEFI